MANPTNPFWWTGSGTKQQVINAAAAQMQSMEKIDLVRMIENSLATQDRAINDMVFVIGQSFASIQGSDRNRFKQAHMEVGQAAQRSLVQAFRSRRFRRPAGQYRAGENRLSGTLGPALARSDHVRANEYSLEFLNLTVLDKEAAHWRRLNFGAGRGGEEGIIAPQKFPISWGGLMVGVLGLDAQPSAGFRIPRGYWIGPEGRVPADKSRIGQDQFFLIGQIGGRGIRGRPSAGVMTAGIASRNFVDAGIRRIANELPRAYEAIYNDLYHDARPLLQEAATRASATVVRPTSQRISYHYRRPNRGNAGSL